MSHTDVIGDVRVERLDCRDVTFTSPVLTFNKNENVKVIRTTEGIKLSPLHLCSFE